jgi:hypothetical protein
MVALGIEPGTSASVAMKSDQQTTEAVAMETYGECGHYLGTASVIKWSEFLAANPEVPGSIPGDTRFSE